MKLSGIATVGRTTTTLYRVWKEMIFLEVKELGMQWRYSKLSKETNLSSVNENFVIISEPLRHRRFSITLMATAKTSARETIRPVAVT